MLTPQEVSTHSFAKAVMGGYNMAMVDEFLDELTDDYAALYKENAALKAKMKVLVEKVEEYRATEDAMRKALMTAQRMADELVKEAQDQRDQLLQQAQAEAKQQVESIRQEVEAEQYRLTCAQQETAAYVQKVKALHQQTLTYLDQLEQITPQQPQEEQPAQPDAVDQAVSDIDDSVQRLVAKAMAEAKEENEKARQSQDLSDTAEFPAQGAKEPEVDDMEQTTRIDFGELQFGRDYEIK